MHSINLNFYLAHNWMTHIFRPELNEINTSSKHNFHRYAWKHQDDRWMCCDSCVEYACYGYCRPITSAFTIIMWPKKKTFEKEREKLRSKREKGENKNGFIKLGIWKVIPGNAITNILLFLLHLVRSVWFCSSFHDIGHTQAYFGQYVCVNFGNVCFSYPQPNRNRILHMYSRGFP